MSSEPSTPLMRQYHGIKKQVPNALLLFLIIFAITYVQLRVARRFVYSEVSE